MTTDNDRVATRSDTLQLERIACEGLEGFPCVHTEPALVVEAGSPLCGFCYLEKSGEPIAGRPLTIANRAPV